MNFQKIVLFSGMLGLMTICEAQKSGWIRNEILPAKSSPCFPGAYYRKAATSFDAWTGITGTVILGYPAVDEGRLDQKTHLPLDNFSVYMGGNAQQHEVDAGLTWEFSKDSMGNRSARRNCWRPFWRTTIWNSAPNKPEFIWKPGDTVKMTVMIVGYQKLRMIISDVHKSEKSFQTDFEAPGFSFNVPVQFKRVNAIDQSHNEGKPVQPTLASVKGAEWLETYLMRGPEHQQYLMNKSRFTDIRCNDSSHVKITETNSAHGGEKIDIMGTVPEAR